MSTRNPVRRLASGVFFSLLVTPWPVLAQGAMPFYTRDQNPLVLIYGLPTPTSAKIIEPGTTQLSASLNVSNTLNEQGSGDEYLFVDVETYRLNLVYDYGITDDWMLRLLVPFIKYSGGFMDDWIDDYHNLLHLPENIRPLYPNDQLNIHYSLNGNSQFSLTQSASGVGDIALQTAWQAVDSNDFHLSYWLSVELPSGDSSKLTGSGSTDLALWLATDSRLQDDIWAYGNLGTIFMTNSDVLPRQHNNMAMFASAGLQFHPWRPVQLKVQLDMHSAFYDSSTKFLGHVVQFTFGGSILLGRLSTLDIAVAEDIQENASPDVNFNFTWRRRF